MPLPALPDSGDYLISDAEFAKRVDLRSIADLLSDDPANPIWDEEDTFATNKAAVLAHENYIALKHTASGMVQTALQSYGRYTSTTVFDIAAIDFGFLYQFMANLMVCLAYQRRPDRRREEYPVFYDQTWIQLEAIKDGSIVFATS